MADQGVQLFGLLFKVRGQLRQDVLFPAFVDDGLQLLIQGR
jgi:hypothetical protein